MSIALMGRRRFLTLPLGLLLAPLSRVSGEPVMRRGQYAVDVGVLRIRAAKIDGASA